MSALPLAVCCGFALAGVAFNLIVFFCAKRRHGGAQGEAIRQKELENSVQALRQSVEALAGRAQDCQEPRFSDPAPGAFTAGLNMTTRSQALRMHRKGDPAERIADILKVPLQEVELLLKVNRIIVKKF